MATLNVRLKPPKLCEWCGVSYSPYTPRQRWHTYECFHAAKAKEKIDRQVNAAQRKRDQVTELIDELVATAVLFGYSKEFYALSRRLRHRGLSFDQVYGLVQAYIATRLKRRQTDSEDAALVLRVMEKLGQTTRGYDEFRAELIDYFCA